MKRRRFLLLSRCLEYGGAERQIVTLTKALHARGHDVTLAVFYAGGALAHDLAAAGVKVVSLEKSGRWDVINFLLNWARLLLTLRPEVVHSYLIVPNLVALSAKVITPRTRVVWGVRDAYQNINERGRLAVATFTAQRFLAGFADLVITNSQAGGRTITALGFSPKKLLVIPNGINTLCFRPDVNERNAIRAEFGVPPECKLIGIVGRLDPVKGHYIFIEAASMLLQHRTDVKFLIVGDGSASQKKSLRDLSSSLQLEPSVIWTGARSDIPAILNSLDVLTSCSLSEGFSNVIGEALASGVYCVVTDVGDSALIVGDCGVVIRPADPAALAGAWTEILNSRQVPRDYIRNRISQAFTVDHLVTRTEEALCSIQ